MNNYAVWWDDTVTVYNGYEDPQTHLKKWYRTVLTNCFYKDVGENIKINNVELDTNTILCRIPIKSNYLKPYEWIALPNDQKSNFFTLKQGDIIVEGEVTEEIDEYSKGQRSTDFVAKYKALQGCLTIERVGDNTGIGRGNEHYHVRGI